MTEKLMFAAVLGVVLGALLMLYQAVPGYRDLLLLVTIVSIASAIRRCSKTDGGERS